MVEVNTRCPSSRGKSDEQVSEGGEPMHRDSRSSEISDESRAMVWLVRVYADRLRTS